MAETSCTHLYAMAAAIKNMNSALPDPDIKQTNQRGHEYQTRLDVTLVPCDSSGEIEREV